MSYISFVAQQNFLDENGLNTDEALFDYDMVLVPKDSQKPVQRLFW